MGRSRYRLPEISHWTTWKNYRQTSTKPNISTSEHPWNSLFSVITRILSIILWRHSQQRNESTFGSSPSYQDSSARAKPRSDAHANCQEHLLWSHPHFQLWFTSLFAFRWQNFTYKSSEAPQSQWRQYLQWLCIQSRFFWRKPSSKTTVTRATGEIWWCGIAEQWHVCKSCTPWE